MRKIILIFVTLVFFFVSNMVFAEQEQRYNTELSKSDLVLNNFIADYCHVIDKKIIIPKYNLLTLDPRYIGKVSPPYSTACKGENICWSRIMTDYEISLLAPGFPNYFKNTSDKSKFSYRLVSSTLPLKINNLNKLSESIASTIKETQSLRKSSNSLVSAAQEFLNSSFGAGKEKAVIKERSITQSESRERATELDITPQFHLFLTKAISGPFETAVYPACMASAADLFLRAYERDKVNDLVTAFVFYKTVKPDDIDFSSRNDILNRAKFFYVLLHDYAGYTTDEQKDFAWAQSILFASLLDWSEFEKVRQFVDLEIQKAYAKYSEFLSKTTSEIYEKDKELASLKYAADVYISKSKLVADTDKNKNEIRDIYIMTAIAPLEPFKQTFLENLQNALSNSDPLVNKRFVENKNNKVAVFLFLGLICILFVSVAIFIKSKKK